MIKIFERKQIGDGIWFSRIVDKRFKTNYINVAFITDFDELSRADYAIVPYLLTDCCEKYPSRQSLYAYCMELYGAWLENKIDLNGRRRVSSVSLWIPDDRFALEGEKLEREGCRLLTECILRPNAKNGAFDAELTRLMRAELIDSIDSVMNDKRSLAGYRGAKIAYEGEPAGELIQGTHEQAEQVTPESAYKAYRRMLEHGRIEIYAAGRSNFTESERVLREAFSEIDRRDICTLCTKPSALKPEPRRVTEKFPMQQAITRMYFKAPETDDRFANVLLGMILGGMTTSRFFTNIREKQSLCYYCSSVTYRLSKELIAYAGVEPHNAERTQAAILAEIEDIRKNGVTAEELERAKLEVADEIPAVYDTVGGIAKWYMNQLHDEEYITPEEYVEKIRAVTAERVQAVCKMYSLDTVFTLSGEEAGE